MSLLLVALILLLNVFDCLAVPDNRAENPVSFTDAEKKWLQAHPTVTVRISRAYPPFEFYQDGEFQGIAVDYLNAISGRLGIEFEPAPDMPWADALESIREKQGVDMVLLITHTSKRESFLEFTEDYIFFPQVIFTTTHAPFISGIRDLRGRRVAVEKGYIMRTWLARDVPGVMFVEVESSEDALRAVSVGEAEAYVGDLAVGQYYIEKKGFINLKVAAPTPYDVDNMAMGVRKDWPELAGLLDKTLASFTDEEHNAIKQRWLAIRYEYGIGIMDVVKWVLLVSALALLWIFQLRVMVRKRTHELTREIAEREKADAALRESERNYREIFNATNEAIFLHDAGTGAILDVNRTMLEMYGYSHEEALQLKVRDLSSGIAPYSQDEAVQFVQKAVEEGPQVFEWQARRKNGELFWVEVALRSSDIGGEGRVLAVVRDVSARKEAEERNIQAQKNLERIMEATPYGIVIIDKDKTIMHANAAALNMMGYDTPGHIVGNICHDNICPAQKGKCPILDLGKTVDRSEKVLLTRDGKKMPILKSVVPILFDNEEMLLEAFVDITELKQTKEHLQREMYLTENILNSLPGVFYMFNGQGAIVRWNNTVEAVTEYTSEEISKMIHSDFVPERDRELISDKFREALTTREASLESALLTKDGTEIPYYFTGILIELEGENYLIGMGTDISELKKANEEIRRSLREKELMLSEIHHRVKNNMAVISAFLNLQAKQAQDEKIKEILFESINRIKSMSLVHEKLYKYHDFTSIDFKDYVRSLATGLLRAYNIPSSVIALNIDIAEISIGIDTSVPLGLLINELLSNAIRHAFPDREKGRISITLERINENEFMLMVSDNGIGMPESIDIENPETLGLQIIDSLLTQLQGKMEVSREGGTQFRVAFVAQKAIA